MPTCGNAAASTALPHPPSTSHRVPKNSAVNLLLKGISSSPPEKKNCASARRQNFPLLQGRARTGWWNCLSADEAGIGESAWRAAKHLQRADYITTETRR